MRTKRDTTINALIALGCKKDWCEQFKTQDLKEMLEKITWKSKEQLTQELIIKEIEQFRFEWMVDNDWWYRSNKTYKNAIYGYGVNLIHDEKSNQIIVAVYALKPSEEDLEIPNETLFRFAINIQATNWEVGQLITPIAIEEGAPFEMGKTFIITKKDYSKSRSRVIYTINTHIDFKYSSNEIAAYFKEAV